MRFSYYAAVASCLLGSVSGYFQITNPTRDTKWVNDQAFTVQWSKGLYDGIPEFDLELSRLSKDGLILVARNVPVSPSSISLHLTDIPPGDDYFLLFINSTHGVMYATSPRFTILPSGQTAAANTTGTSATITVSGGPNPTAAFATTFPAHQNGAVPLWSSGMAMALGTTMIGTMLGVWTVWI